MAAGVDDGLCERAWRGRRPPWPTCCFAGTVCGTPRAPAAAWMAGVGLAGGQVMERVLRVEELHRCEALAVVSSLRGVRPAVLADGIDDGQGMTGGPHVVNADQVGAVQGGGAAGADGGGIPVVWLGGTWARRGTLRDGPTQGVPTAARSGVAASRARCPGRTCRSRWSMITRRGTPAARDLQPRTYLHDVVVDNAMPLAGGHGSLVHHHQRVGSAGSSHLGQPWVRQAGDVVHPGHARFAAPPRPRVCRCPREPRDLVGHQPVHEEQGPSSSDEIGVAHGRSRRRGRPAPSADGVRMRPAAAVWKWRPPSENESGVMLTTPITNVREPHSSRR